MWECTCSARILQGNVGDVARARKLRTAPVIADLPYVSTSKVPRPWRTSASQRLRPFKTQPIHSRAVTPRRPAGPASVSHLRDWVQCSLLTRPKTLNTNCVAFKPAQLILMRKRQSMWECSCFSRAGILHGNAGDVARERKLRTVLVTADLPYTSILTNATAMEERCL